MFESVDIFKLCKPFYAILKAFGLACFTIDKKTKALKVTLFDKMFLAVTIFLWISLTKVQLSKRFDAKYKNVVDSTLLDNLWLHQYIIQHVCGLFTIVYSFAQRKKIGDLLKIISNFDRKSSNFNCNATGQEKIFRMSILLFLICIFILILYVIIFSIKNNFSTRYTTAVIAVSCCNYFFIVLFYVVLSEQFIVSVFCIRARLTALIIKLR